MAFDPKKDRKKSIGGNLNIDTDDEPEEEETSKKDEKNEQPPEGNDGDGSEDSYIDDEDNEKENSDEEELGNENSVLHKTFDGDVDKLEQSYLEAQKSAGRQAQELKSIKSELDDLKNTKQVLDNNPTLKELYNKAEEGEDVESLVANRRSEPDENDGKSDNSPSNDGKFDGIDDEFLPDKNKLIEEGYLDEEVDSLNDFDKKASILNAQQAYVSQNLGSQIGQQVRQARKKVKKEEKKENEKEKLGNTNQERLEEGFDEAITDYDLDFKEHPDLYEDIMEEVKGFRDPQDNRLIRENAVKLATREVLKQKGMDDKLQSTHSRPSKPTDEEKEENFSTKRSGNKDKSKKSDQDLTLEEQMQERRKEKSNQQIGRRQNIYRT